MDTIALDFRENPFAGTPDPRFVYATRTYRQAYVSLLSGIRERKGFLLVTGEKGAGTTTLLTQLTAQQDVIAHGFIIDSAALSTGTFEELLGSFCTQLGLTQGHSGRLQLLQALNAWLVAQSQEGKTIVFFLDEAHHLPDDTLGHLRSLMVFDKTHEKSLLQIVLAGQPELERKLAQPNLRPLRQRIAVACRLEGMEEQEIEPFIHHRLRAAGHEQQDVFSPDALQRIAVYSRGVPGLITIICDRALLKAASASLQTASAATVEEVSRALQLVTESANRENKRNQDGSVLAREGAAKPQEEKARPSHPVPVDIRVPPRKPRVAEASTTQVRARVDLGKPLLVTAVLLTALTGGLLYYYTRPTLILTQDSPRLPTITRVTPPQNREEEDLIVDEGQQLTFAVEAAYAGSAPLQYVWFLNGQEQAQTPEWTYRPQFNEGGAAHKEVVVRIADREGHVAERKWRLQVQNVDRPPRLVAVFPTEQTVRATAGQEQRFSLEATDPDTEDQLSYVWTLDGKEVARSQQWAFTPPAVQSTHEHAVAVSISDKAGSTLERQWTVTVVPPVLPPPVITRVTPVGNAPTLAEGQQLAFAVEAESAQQQPLQYLWLLDGQVQARGPRWTYKPQFDGGGTTAKTVTVRVLDREQHAVERSWSLSVQHVNRAPTIARLTPPPPTFTIPVGGEQAFSIEATDPDKNDSLLFVWSLDGQEVARGQNWRFRAAPTLGTPRSHTVQMEVTDSGGLKQQAMWNVIVKPPALPPRILAAEPADERVAARVGESSVFALQAAVEGEAASKLHYEWKINDAPWKTTATGRFQLEARAPGRYQLTAVAVSAEGTRSAPRTWSIEIRPPAAPSPPPTIAARPPMPVTPPPASITYEEVRTWLETHRHALEERKVDRLVEIGALDSAQAERARAILSRYTSFHVAFQDVSIQVAPNQATASFLRVDEIDGQKIPHPERKIFVFEKGQNGHLNVHPQ